MTITQLKTIRHHGHNLTAVEALFSLAEHGDADMTTMADRLMVSTASVTGIADRLVKDGLIQRAASKLDRRTINLSITEKGRARYFQITGRESLIHPTGTPTSGTPRMPSPMTPTHPTSTRQESPLDVPTLSPAAFDEVALAVETSLQTRSGETPQSALLENWASVPFVASASPQPHPEHPSPEESVGPAQVTCLPPVPEPATPALGKSASSLSPSPSSAHFTTPA